jgi:hypothetical protein
MRFSSRAVLLAALSPWLSAQSAAPAPGFRLFGPINSTVTWLVDTTGAIVHTWPSAFLPGLGVYMLEDGSLLRAIASTTPPAGLAGAGGGVQRLAFDGRVLWDWRLTTPGLLNHHDIQPLPNGNVLLTVWEDKTVGQAVAMGRDPALISGNVFRADSIYELQPNGPNGANVVWSWHLTDHLIQDFDPAQANYGVVALHPERLDVNFPPVATEAFDWNHCNGLDYDPVHDWIVLSAPRQNEIWIIDHGTTTAEAASSSGGHRGHGGDLLYRWGNPQSYRAGTAGNQQLFFEHDPRFVRPGCPGEGHLTVFDNGFATNNSAAIELVLPLDANDNFVMGSNGRYGPIAPLWNYTAEGFFSGIVSSVERLPNGDTLICSGTQGHVFEVTQSGDEVWSFTVPGPQTVFHAQYVDRSLWVDRDTLPIAAGGTARFDLVAGSAHAGELYLLLGTVSGTTPGFEAGPVHVPLNIDFFTDFTGGAANGALLVNTLGLLSPGGIANAFVTLPSGVAPAGLAGLRLDFAYVIADANTLQLRMASSTAGFTLVP